MASSQVPEEGAEATFAVPKNVEEGRESAAARPDRLCFMHKDVADFLLSASRRRGTKATPPPGHEEGERARYDCKFEEDEDAEGFAPPRLVWGKVRSHQWWPGQVFDPANASELAQQQRRKRGSVLVAFFWDKTFGWADAAALCPLRAGFPWLVPSSRGPCASAVAAALGEVARRVEAGLSCSCDGAAAKKQVIENSGVRDGACGAAPDSAFRGEAFVGYISSLAVAPLAGADGLELTIATAQLRAFTRWRGPRGLPEYTDCYSVDGVEAAAPARRARKRRRSRGGDDADASAGAWSMSRCGGTEDEACESADDAMGLQGSDGRSRTKIGKLMSRAAQQMSKSPVSGAMARCTSVADDTDAAVKNGDLKDEPLHAGLVLNFTNPSAVPSASDLVSMFSQFGPIEEARTTGNSVAAVIFKRRADADDAMGLECGSPHPLSLTKIGGSKPPVSGAMKRCTSVTDDTATAVKQAARNWRKNGMLLQPICFIPAKLQEPTNCRRFSSVPGTQMINKLRSLPKFNLPERIDSVDSVLNKELKAFDVHEISPIGLLAGLSDDTKELAISQFDLTKLQDIYDAVIRNILVSSGMLVDQSDRRYVKALDAELAKVLKQKGPMYITSLDLMLTLAALDKLKWIHLLDFLRRSKILVLEGWTATVPRGTIETMYYTHGLKLAGEDDQCKGMSDAAYSGGKGNLCSIIWKNQQVIDCCLCLQVTCNCNLHAEFLAMYLLMRRAIEKDIKNLGAVTDNQHCCDTMRGQLVDTAYPDLSKVMLGLKAKFHTFMCQLEYREKLHFADSLATNPKMASEFNDLLDSWSPHLQGLPIFRFHMKRTHTLSKFIGKLPTGGFLGKLDREYKVVVGMENNKIDLAINLIESLSPMTARILVRERSVAELLQKKLTAMKKLGLCNLEVEEDCYCLVLILGGGGNTGKARMLLLSYDECLSEGYNYSPDTLHVRLVKEGESYHTTIREVRPECQLFFTSSPQLDMV